MENYQHMDAFYAACLEQLKANGLQEIDILILNAGISSRGKFYTRSWIAEFDNYNLFNFISLL